MISRYYDDDMKMTYVKVAIKWYEGDNGDINIQLTSKWLHNDM